MATFRPPFGYNTGGPISGTTQYNDFVIGNVEVDYSSDYGGIKWWASPEEITGYIIGNARPGGQPVPSGVTGTAQVGFWRSKGRTDQAFLDLANYIGAKNGQPTFATTYDAEIWLENNGYYTSFNLPTPTPTITQTPTPQVTSTPTQTPTNTLTPTPSITASPTITQTPTNTITPTNTTTSTQTSTPSVTPTQTPTQTSTNTNTPTPSITASQTVSPTVTQTPTNTNTSSVTVTNTPTTTTTPTVTPTPNIVTSGLVIQLDAYNSSSYPGTGTTVYDITGGYNHTLIGATYTVLNGIKCFDCTTGTNRVNYNATGPTLPNSGYTYITWARLMPSTAGFRTLLYTSGPPKITPITIPNGTSTLGYWATAFVSSTYDISSSASVWVQLAVVGTNTSQTFYLNGAQVGSTINEGAGGTRHWGWGNNDVSGQPWGHVANMYFYNRGLSLAEITQQYNYLAPRFVEPTPTPTTTSTPSVTPTQTLTPTTTTTPTPTQTPQFFLLFEDSSIATAENNDNIEIDII